jgi:hypothetical protein
VHEPLLAAGGPLLLAARGGTVTRHEGAALAVTAQVLAGAVRGLAASADGRWLLVALADPPSLALFDAGTLQAVREYPAADLRGRAASAVAAVVENTPRRSFVAAFAGLPELWEISRDPDAPPIFDGLVHDYRMGEAIARSGFLGVRRTPLEEAFQLLAPSVAGREVVGRGPGGTLDIVNLDVRRRIGRIAVDAPRLPEEVAAFEGKGRQMLALVDAGSVRMVDMAAGAPVGSVPLADARFVCAHANAPHLWVGVQPASGPGSVAVVEKAGFRIAAVLPARGRLAGRGVFLADGSRWVAALRDAEPAWMVHDTRTLARVM